MLDPSEAEQVSNLSPNQRYSYKFKVLFVHDAAQTARDLAPHLNDLDIQTQLEPLAPILQMIRKIRASQADLVHVNYIRSPAIAAWLSLKRPYVLHAHGDDVRYGLGWKQKLALRSSSLNFYATVDLVNKVPHSFLIPQPIDPAIFNEELYRNSDHLGKALYVIQTKSDPRLRFRESDYILEAKDYCKKRNLELQTIQGGEIPYDLFPKFLSQFSLLFDKEFPEKVLSKTALQALNIGLTVLKNGQEIHKGDWIRKHYAQNVASLLASYYEAVLNKEDPEKIAKEAILN